MRLATLIVLCPLCLPENAFLYELIIERLKDQGDKNSFAGLFNECLEGCWGQWEGI